MLRALSASRTCVRNTGIVWNRKSAKKRCKSFQKASRNPPRVTPGRLKAERFRQCLTLFRFAYRDVSTIKLFGDARVRANQFIVSDGPLCGMRPLRADLHCFRG